MSCAQCIICCDTIEVVDAPTLTSKASAFGCRLDGCQHTAFHFRCLMTWAHIAAVCPLCKAPFQVVEKTLAIETLGKQNVCVADSYAVAALPRCTPPRAHLDIDTVCCGVCGQGDNEAVLLICDGDCGGAAHTHCVGLDHVPEGEWFCGVCGEKRARAGRRASEADITPREAKHLSAVASMQRRTLTLPSTTSTCWLAL